MKKLLSLLILAMLTVDAIACTSAIITGRLTPDGRPLMWKHRDTGTLDNRMEWFEGKEYSFLSLVNAGSKGGESWMGSNEVGFSIMNTASYNLKDDDVKEMDQEGTLMHKALGECRTIADFEKFLDNCPRPIRVEANFGVIDADGGAAYYEVNNTEWIKVDVNDTRIAPHGYLVYTNFSFTGRPNEGFGYIRYDTAENAMRVKAREGNITPVWIMNNLSRSFVNSLIDIDMEKLAKIGSGWITDSDYIPRNSTASSVVFQGLKKGDAPDKTILWTTLGYTPVSATIPLFVAARDKQPAFVLKNNKPEMTCPINDLSMELKKNVFSQHRGNGQDYVNYNVLSNKKGTGYMQKVKRLDEKIYESFIPYICKFHSKDYVLNVDELLNLQNYNYNKYVKVMAK